LGFKSILKKIGITAANVAVNTGLRYAGMTPVNLRNLAGDSAKAVADELKKSGARPLGLADLTIPIGELNSENYALALPQLSVGFPKTQDLEVSQANVRKVLKLLAEYYFWASAKGVLSLANNEPRLNIPAMPPDMIENIRKEQKIDGGATTTPAKPKFN